MTIQESPLRYSGPPSTRAGGGSTNLAELLERILDKGIVIAGDISISLVDVELLTIKLRLLIASVDKAREMGVDWWEADPWLSSRAARPAEGRPEGSRPRRGDAAPAELEARMERLESALAALVDDRRSNRRPAPAGGAEDQR